MTTKEKIQKAQERIKELNILISHWENTIYNINYKELGIKEVDAKGKDIFIAA